MAKAETGVAGPVVAELAYRNEYISVRAQSKLAEEAWRRNKCQEEAAGYAGGGAGRAIGVSQRHTLAVAVRQRGALEGVFECGRATATPASRKSSPAAPACVSVPSP